MKRYSLITCLLLLAFSFCASSSQAQAPANDQPCNATQVTFGVPISFDLVGGTADPGEVFPTAGGPGSCNTQTSWCFFENRVQNSVWFEFQMPTSGCINAYAGGFDTQIALWVATDCNDYTTYTLIAANDDSGNLVNPSLPASGPAGLKETSCQQAGQTYLLQVDGFNGATGQGVLVVTDCGNAPLSVDAGGCQLAIKGDPAVQDTNFLYATVNGGFPPYDIQWNGPGILYSVGDKAAVMPSSAGLSTYTITVTDEIGCTVTDDVEVTLTDIRACHPNGKKVLVCHVPPGNPRNAHEICISENAIAAHFDPNRGHTGCYLGPCLDDCVPTGPSFPPPPPCADLEITMTGDAFAGLENNWVLTDLTTGNVIQPSSGISPGVTETYTYCVEPSHCFEFLIEDNFGDGFGFGGGYSITFQDTTISSNFVDPFFGQIFSETQLLGNCPNKTSLQVEEEAFTSKVYPNPFRDHATLEFTVPESGAVQVELFSVDGQRKSVVWEGELSAGTLQTAKINGTSLPAGFYIYRIITPSGFHLEGKLILAK